MNKYMKSTKFLKKHIIATPLISIALNGSKKNAKLCLSWTTMLFVIHRLSKRHHNKSYDNENNNKKGKNPNFNRKVREEKIEAIETIRCSLKNFSAIH